MARELTVTRRQCRMIYCSVESCGRVCGWCIKPTQIQPASGACRCTVSTPTKRPAETPYAAALHPERLLSLHGIVSAPLHPHTLTTSVVHPAFGPNRGAIGSMWAWEGGDLRKDPILGARAALDRLQGLLSLPAPSADVAGGAPEQAGGARRLKQALRPQTDSAAFWRAQLRAHLISTAGALVQVRQPPRALSWRQAASGRLAPPAAAPTPAHPVAAMACMTAACFHSPSRLEEGALQAAPQRKPSHVRGPPASVPQRAAAQLPPRAPRPAPMAHCSPHPPPSRHPQYGGVLSAVASVMSPQGPGCCDHNGRERAANLLTSLPYAWIGVHGLR